MDPTRQAEIVGAIYQALMESPSAPEEGTLRYDLAASNACSGIDAQDLADVLAQQDDDMLSAVAGRTVTRLAGLATGVALG